MVKITGKNKGERLSPGIGASESAIRPFFTGSLEFGYSEFDFYPFTEDYRIYPTEHELAQFDPKKDINLI